MYRFLQSRSGHPSKFWAWAAMLAVSFVPAAGQTALEAEYNLDLPEILDAFISEHGGRDNYEDVKSVKWLGKLSQDEVNYKVVLFRKRPNLMRLVLERENYRVSLGFDGVQAWRQREIDGEKRPVELLEGHLFERVKREADFDWPYFLLMHDETKSELVGLDEGDGEPVYILKLEWPGVKQFDLYLDTDTFNVRKTYVVDDRGQAVEDIYQDFAKVGEIPFASRVQTRLDDDSGLNRLEWTHIEVNIGLYDFFFDMPSGPRAVEDPTAETF